jgi:hypothetical protein
VKTIDDFVGAVELFQGLLAECAAIRARLALPGDEFDPSVASITMQALNIRFLHGSE